MILDIKITIVTEEYFSSKYGQEGVQAACPDKYNVEVLDGVEPATLAHEIAHALDEEGVGIFSACGKYPFWRELSTPSKNLITCYPSEMRKFEAFAYYVEQTPSLLDLIINGFDKTREELVEAIFKKLDEIFN